MRTEDLTLRNVALGVGAGALAGAGIAGARFSFGIKTAITQGGSPWGGTINWYLARRGVIGFGVKQALKGNLSEALTMMRAEKQVRTLENEIFYLGAKQVGKKFHIGYDNGPDAFRHAGGSALIKHRLMQQSGKTGDEAVEFLKAAGNAHERDSFLHAYDTVHARNSGDMDVFNNALGAQIAIDVMTRQARMSAEEIAIAAEQHMNNLPVGLRDAFRSLDPSEQIVLSEVLGAIETGRAVTMTPVAGTTGMLGIHQKPHPRSAADIYLIATHGSRQVRTMAPHAQGFPMPFEGGRYVRGKERVPMNIKQLFKSRPEVAQQR